MKHLLVLILCCVNFVVAQDNTAIQNIKAYQKKLNTQFKTPGKSPLTDADRANFKQLDFFPINLSYRVKAQFKRIENPTLIMLGSSSGRSDFLLPYATLIFKLNGKEHSLTVYQNPSLLSNPAYEDYLFLPFTDLTSGKNTYAMGRYIDLTIPNKDTIIVDFNQSYNPYCAYSDKWVCTIPPQENHLATEVNAGVKYHKH